MSIVSRMDELKRKYKDLGLELAGDVGSKDTGERGV
jgi:hypothetical protein